AVALPAPVLVGGVLLQPPGAEIVSVAVALVLYVAGLAVAYGGDLAKDTEAGGAKFEARRLGKAAVMLTAISGLMFGVAQLGFLFPPAQESEVIAPKRPEVPREAPVDRHLFTAEMERNVPLRLGVLDVYDEVAWLTPPFDPNRLVEVTGPLQAASFVGETFDVTITIKDIGQQREVPIVAGAVTVTDPPDGLQFDPRTNTLRVQARLKGGTTYTVAATMPPGADLLREAPEPGPELDEFLTIPDPPAVVRALLQEIPAGAGNPVDVPPERVSQMLQGAEATPYEITAAEVMLARWVGVPARIGFGYFDAEGGDTTTHEIRPANGAMWLETYFEGQGWVPIIGRPQQARASLSDDQKQDSSILPSGELAAQLYIPVRQTSLLQFYSIVQFWLARIVPVFVGIFFFWFIVPGLVKGARLQRRRRWAERRGVLARISVAYADFRDRAIDLNIGHPSWTPLEFLDAIDVDEDHTNMAWLVTRALWGDLARDLREEDAESAESAGRSLTKRLSTGQPFIQRSIAYGSRVSLRSPWSCEVPNLWWEPQIRIKMRVLFRRVRAAVTFKEARRQRALNRIGRPPRAKFRIPGLSRTTLLMVALMAMTLSGCVQDVNLAELKGTVGPLPEVPEQVGDYVLKLEEGYEQALAVASEQALIGDLALYSINDRGLTVGTLQVAGFKPGLDGRQREVLSGVLGSLGGNPEVSVVAGERIYSISINQLRLIVFFAEDGKSYQLLAAGPEFENPEAAFVSFLAAQRGEDVPDAAQLAGVPPRDIRRGMP
ncbi:MAG: hypothetical protein ACI867_001844, partial [Glaciecola sp.]